MKRKTDMEVLVAYLTATNFEELPSETLGGVIYRVFQGKAIRRYYIAPTGKIRGGLDLPASTRLPAIHATEMMSAARAMFPDPLPDVDVIHQFSIAA